MADADQLHHVADVTEAMRHLTTAAAAAAAAVAADSDAPAAATRTTPATSAKQQPLSPPTPAGEGYAATYAPPHTYAAPAAASAPGTPPTYTLASPASTSAQAPHPHAYESAPGSPGMGMGLATAAASALVTNDLGEPIVSMRVLLTSKAAGVCIGVRGATMDALRKHSGAKAGVSKLIEGVNDRVLNLVGTVTELSKAVLFVATTLAQHPITSGGESGAAPASTPAAQNNQHTTLRLLVPNAVMGSLIGRGGTHIKHMQEAHMTRMVTAKECLPVSTERTVDVTGTPVAIASTAGEIAALVADEWDRVVQTTRLYDPRVRVPSVGYQFAAAMQAQHQQHADAPISHQRAATASTASHSAAHSAQATPTLGTLPHAHYAYTAPAGARVRAPSAPHVQFAPPPQLSQQQHQHQHDAFPEFVSQPASPNTTTATTAAAASSAPNTSFPAGRRASTVSSAPQLTGPAHAASVAMPLHDYVTQSVGIPDGLVGSLIGRGGARISEIRATSGARILIDRVANALGDRMFQLSGSRASVEAALRMIYQQLAAEKERRVLAAQQEEQELQQQQQQQEQLEQKMQQQQDQAAAEAGAESAAVAKEVPESAEEGEIVA